MQLIAGKVSEVGEIIKGLSLSLSLVVMGC